MQSPLDVELIISFIHVIPVADHTTEHFLEIEFRKITRENQVIRCYSIWLGNLVLKIQNIIFVSRV